MLVQGGGQTPRRLADDRLQVVAALVAGLARAAADARLPRGSLLATRALPAASAEGGAGADLRGQASLGLGAAAHRRRDRARARDRLADAQAGGDLACAEAAAGAAAPVRVALPRRSAARGQQALRSLPEAGARGHRRPARDGRREADAGRLRVRALARRRSLAARLQRAPPRRTGGDRLPPSSSAGSPSTRATASSRGGCSPTTPSSTAQTAACASCSPEPASGTCSSPPAARR